MAGLLWMFEEHLWKSLVYQCQSVTALQEQQFIHGCTQISADGKSFSSVYLCAPSVPQS